MNGAVVRANCFKFTSVTVLPGIASTLALLTVGSSVGAATVPDTLRIVTWNIEADINNYTTPRPNFNTVLQGIGNEQLGSASEAQPLDIMALEETTSNTATVAPIVTDLNGDYGAGTYAMSTYQGKESGNDATDGNGPNALVYNTKTVTLLASQGIDPGATTTNPYGSSSNLGSSSGEDREVVRYEFEAVGSTSPFYIYVSHMKSGSNSSDATARGEEATIIRNNEAATLPANASVLYMGDLNSAPPEAEFTTFSSATATNTTTNTTVTQGEAYDPENYSSSVQYWSESSTDLRYRDDYQLQTSNVAGGTGAIDYVAGTLNNFGNNGTTSSGGTVNSSSNTALAYMNGGVYGSGNYPSQSQILSALTTASDHLPVVADYTFPVPEPTSLGLFAALGALLPFRRRR